MNSYFKNNGNLHATLRRKADEHDYAIIMGDFNETLRTIDRSYHIEKGEKQGRLMKDTVKKLRDVYRKIHKNIPGYTNITNTKRKDDDNKNLTTEARLDYILTSKNIAPLAAAVESKTIQPLDPTAKAHTVTTSHLPLTAKVQLTIRTITHKAYKRPTLRTSNISDKTKQKYIASIEARLAKINTLEELEAAALELGTRMIGLKGKKRPTRHTKADTKIGKLRSQIAALEQMTAALQNMATTNDKWTSFVKRFAANLPTEVKTPNNLKTPTNDEDRRRRHTLFSSIRQALRAQYNLQQARITQNVTSEGHTNVFREAYRSYMQKYKHGSLDHILSEGEIIDDPKQLHAILLEHLRDKYKSDDDIRIQYAPQTDKEVDECIENITLPHIEKKIAASNIIPNKDDFRQILLRKKPNLDPSIYAKIMSDITPDELQEELANAETQTAAGTDAINKWWWKQLLANAAIQQTTLREFNTYLREGRVPETDAIIFLILKKAGPGNLTSNLRPLTIQHAIRKIFTGILARRLTKLHT